MDSQKSAVLADAFPGGEVFFLQPDCGDSSVLSGPAGDRLRVWRDRW